MFVKCFARKPIVYHNYGRTLVLKPGVNCVDESLFPIEGLFKTYGHTVIAVIGESPVAEETPAEENIEAPAAPQNDKDNEIEQLLDDNKEVKDFLEGKTDVLPEGTVEVPTEEALNVKPECADCYSDGKTPDEESCKNCDKVVKPEGITEVKPAKKVTARKSTKRAK